MANYISSNANRFYAAVEATYGQAAAIAPVSRMPAVKLQAHQALSPGRRHDKTGSRTFLGVPATAKRRTAFELQSYLTSWTGIGEPSYGPMFRAALGAAPVFSQGITVASVLAATRIQTAAPHGLLIGNAISSQGEIRFVTGVSDPFTVVFNAPFTNPLSENQTLAPTVSYGLSTVLPSVSIYDYWSPGDTVSRLITGAAVDTAEISVNGDYHRFTFAGPARDLIDSASFVPGQAGLWSYPVEPIGTSFDYSIVPGHLGQAWLGSSLSQFSTLTSAHIRIKNNLDVRDQEFGSSYPSAVTPGPREVVAAFSLMVRDDVQSNALYAAAKQRNLIGAMLQLGQQQGQLMGIFLPNMTPELPSFEDSQTRLEWHFSTNLAQGVNDDEIYIAFA